MWRRPHIDRHTLGGWSFELRGDEIADLAYEGTAVLRSIRAVVRDRDWDTAAWTVASVTATADTVEVSLRTDRLGADIDGVLRVELRDGVLRATFDAVSRAVLATNRTGLVVLHPPQLAGAGLAVGHADGTTSHTTFPVEIAPHQPVFGISWLGWSHDGLEVSMVFAGDVFEMEDQRNWSDASYKTYSRPLDLPFPYDLAAGERVVQSITVTATRIAPAARARADEPIVLRDGGPFPAVSVGAATAPDPAPATVDEVGADLLVELDLASPTWAAALARAASSGLPLDVRIVLADDDTRASLRDAAARLARHPLARIAAFWPTGPARHVSDAAAVDLLREALGEAGVEVPVVGGARSHFTELGREHHRLPADIDGVVFATTPLFHSVDTEQAVEAVAMQRLVATQAVRIAGTLPVHVGPVSLRPHFNDVATTPPPYAPVADLSAGYGPELIDADDPRQDAPELAAWTIASAAALAVPQVASLSYFEQWGPRGIRTATGAERPVAAAVRALASLRGGGLLWGDSPDGLVWAIGARTGSGSRVLVANLDAIARLVHVVVDGSEQVAELAAGAWTTLEP